jgi:hypothetical protein
MINTNEHGDLFPMVWFGRTYSPLRRSGRPDLFQPFPSLKRPPRPVELASLSRGHRVPQGPPHKELKSLVSLYNQENKSEREENNQSSNDHKTMQHSNALSAMSLKHKLIICGAGRAWNAWDVSWKGLVSSMC